MANSNKLKKPTTLGFVKVVKISNIRNIRQLVDSLCSIFAGAGAGALYKSMSGPRAIAVYGAGGALLSGLNVAAQSVMGR